MIHCIFNKYFIDNKPSSDSSNDKKWKVIKLKDLVSRNREKINDYENWKDELLIDLSIMPQFSISLTQFNKGEKLKSNIYKLKEYDLLFGSIRPYFGKVGFSPINGVIAGTIHSFKSINPIHYGYLLSLISSKNFIKYTISVSKGTKMPTIKWDDFIDYNISIPYEESYFKEYNNVIFPIIHKIKCNIDEIQFLNSLRDTLLPKLMSGEIDVSKVEL